MIFRLFFDTIGENIEFFSDQSIDDGEKIKYLLGLYNMAKNVAMASYPDYQKEGAEWQN